MAERARQQAAAYRAANPEKARAAERASKRSPDRRCRYAGSGCGDLAEPGRATCHTHTNLEGSARARRRKPEILRTLADRQGWACLWCNELLPDDLQGVHFDHIIPVSRGGPDDEQWNWSVLHGRCNQAKAASITPLGERLAAEHGVTIASAEKPYRPRRRAA